MVGIPAGGQCRSDQAGEGKRLETELLGQCAGPRKGADLGDMVMRRETVVAAEILRIAAIQLPARARPQREPEEIVVIVDGQ